MQNCKINVRKYYLHYKYEGIITNFKISQLKRIKFKYDLSIKIGGRE